MVAPIKTIIDSEMAPFMPLIQANRGVPALEVGCHWCLIGGCVYDLHNHNHEFEMAPLIPLTQANRGVPAFEVRY